MIITLSCLESYKIGKDPLTLDLTRYPNLCQSRKWQLIIAIILGNLSVNVIPLHYMWGHLAIDSTEWLRVNTIMSVRVWLWKVYLIWCKDIREGIATVANTSTRDQRDGQGSIGSICFVIVLLSNNASIYWKYTRACVLYSTVIYITVRPGTKHISNTRESTRGTSY